MIYSQYAEQESILAVFADAAPGKLLDIGAYHPTVFSNSRALIERGWSAVLVEPSPGPMLNLVRACLWCGAVPSEVYGERKEVACPKCGNVGRYGGCHAITLISAAVGLEPGLLPIQITDDAVSTSDAGVYEAWKKAGGYYGTLHVPQITLEQISLQFGGFDFVNFDAEGMSVPLAIRALELEWRPRCMVVEHDGRIVEVSQAAHAVGYKTVMTNGTNLIFSL